jgi:hypothetical protein
MISTFLKKKDLLRSLTMTLKFLYHENVIDHYENPRNVGSMNKNSKNVGTGLVGAPACGDVMKLQIRVGDDGKIEEAVFKVSILKYFILTSLFLHLDFRLWISNRIKLLRNGVNQRHEY